MPLAGPSSPVPVSVSDREAELAALQTAFDEYIASSRELEDELDAELAKMRELVCHAWLLFPSHTEERRAYHTSIHYIHRNYHVS